VTATVPAKLRAGANVRVVAPSRSGAAFPQPWRAIADRRTAELGLQVTFGDHVDELDSFASSSSASRLADLHAAFGDPAVDGILTFIGGYNANQLLDGLDMGLIRSNPKPFCGYSDITVLQHAVLAGADLVTYSGPHWSTLGMRDHAEQTLDWFRACLFDEAPVVIRPARRWTDDAWFADQDDREPLDTDGWWVLQAGDADGPILGGNLCTLNLLQGTRWWPSLRGVVLVVEDDEESHLEGFARNLLSLLQQPEATSIAGLVIGRFQRASGVSRQRLAQLIADIPQLHGVPVVANVDVGHTNPLFTFPIGGAARLVGDPEDTHLVLTRH
jgi:muramoyltetrapeptide carboxypeptidase LdcA involved in peptidoglycan recycling